MKACILPSAKEKMITSADVCSISPSEFYSIEYLLLALSSPDFQKAVYENSSGAMLKRINKSRLVKIPFGLPPLKEQERIVSAVYLIFEQLDNMQYWYWFSFTAYPIPIFNQIRKLIKDSYKSAKPPLRGRIINTVRLAEVYFRCRSGGFADFFTR